MYDTKLGSNTTTVGRSFSFSVTCDFKVLLGATL